MALGELATASGYGAVASQKWSVAYGVGSQATGQSATAIGGQMVVINGDTWEEEIWSTTASGQESTAIGTAARATQSRHKSDGGRAGDGWVTKGRIWLWPEHKK